ncbi:MAG TPA: DUF1345 domain-containing protein [Myxococcaceae bacterium]|nr:DUF1345 domain-containing protein [Myxococcaceae bacterium]
MTVAGRTVARFTPRNRAMARLLLSAAVGTAAGALVAPYHGWPFRVVTAWDAGLLTLLGLAWSFIGRYGPEQTKHRAASVDPGRNAVFGVVLVASTMSLIAANGAVRYAKKLSPQWSALLVVLSLLAVALAWVAVHTAYTLRYAHLYYREGGEEGGLKFPGDLPPADIDFAYYSFTVGMCFGATDVFLTETRFRKATLGHAVLSFFFNTGILALTLNLIVASLG